MKSNIDTDTATSEINYFVILFMFVGIIFYVVFNSYEPQIDTQYDFFELMFPLSEFVAGAFGLIVAKKYWGSKIFGKAYLALGIGYICAGLGTTTFGIYEVVLLQSNPFPGLSDIFLIPFYLLVFFHLFTCVKHFKKKFSRNDLLLIILLPLSLTSIFVMANIFPVDIEGGIPDLLSQHVEIDGTMFKLVPTSMQSTENQLITINDVTYELVPVEITTTRYEQVPLSDSPLSLIPIVITNYSIGEPYEGDPEYWLGFGLIIFYFILITVNLGLALIGAQIFSQTVLGSSWGLLLFGIILTSVGDIIYFFNALYTYDKTLDLGFWVLGFMIISYALHLHRKRL